jgi:MFS family permease
MISMAASCSKHSINHGAAAMAGLAARRILGKGGAQHKGIKRVAGTHQGSIETRYSWLVATTAVIMLSLAAGGPITVVVGLVQIAEDFGSGRSLPSLANSLAYFGTAIGGMVCGVMVARFGQRLVAMIGGIAVALGLMLASFGESWALLVGLGLGVGLFGNGALFPPMLAYVSLWFDRRRGTALALVASGQYVAGFLWPPIFERAIAAYGWQRTMFGYGILVAAIAVPLAALVLRPPPAQPTSGAFAERMQKGARVLGMNGNLAFFLLAFCSFLCCIPMAMPASHLVAFCGDLGIAASRGALMLSVLLFAAFVARQFWGWLSDKIGGLWTIVFGSLAQILGMLGFLATQDEAGLFFVAAVYGLGFSGIIPAYVLTVRALFPAAEAHWRVPTLLFLSLSGMAAGAWLAGYIHDWLGFYAAAWWAGIGFNLVQFALILFLLLRWRRGLAAV